MAEPRFLSVEDVIDIHTDQIERYGGSLGVRDVELLRSAIGMPEAGFGDQYLHADLFEMAAAYLYHIVQNQGTNQQISHRGVLPQTFPSVISAFMDPIT